jgi:signal transduction histidine kinase
VKELRGAGEHLRPVLERNRIAGLEVKVEPELLVRTEMRPENFHRLIHILVENSVDWSGNVKKPEIRVSVRRLENHCEIIFTDNGSGISEKIADRVFEPGFSWKENGRGMGLAIARSLVELHGGTIDVLHDRRRKGAGFRILLPLKPARATVD